MEINQNTTKINTIKNVTLPELLQKINNLSEAGNGNGETAKCVMGYVQVGSGVKSSGTTICNVSNLGFQPSHVMMWYGSDAEYTSNTSYFLLMSIQEGFATTTTYAKKGSSTYTYIYGGDDDYRSYAKINLNSDGFSLISEYDYLYTGGLYNYMALCLDSPEVVGLYYDIKDPSSGGGGMN